jgi:hypothetical protein
MLEMSEITTRKSDEEETDGLMMRRSPPSIVLGGTTTATTTSTLAIKGLGMLLVGVLLLFATDSIEIQRVRSSSSSDGGSNTAASDHTMNGVVQVKHPAFNETQPITTDGPPPSSPPSSTPMAASHPNPAPATSSSSSDPTTTTITNPQSPDTPPQQPPPLTMESSSRHTYQPRGQPLTDDERQTLLDQWGSWTLVDSKRESRPAQQQQDDFYASYPNRDVPRRDFPSNAWQVDKDYLDAFFPQALALVRRAQEAILAEYGNDGGDKESSSSSSFEERSAMFRVEIMDTWQQDNDDVNGKRASTKQGGFSNRKSWDGLVRRLLHSIMTEDSFVFAMGGHSAAAGHGYVL